MSTAPTTTGSGARRLPRDLVAGILILVGLLLLALLAPLFGDPEAIDPDGFTADGLPLGVLSPGHVLGTDDLGRDMLARVAFGARQSLAIALLANLASVALGVLVGIVAGYRRGWVEHVSMRIVDVFLSVPSVLLGLALASVLGRGVAGVVVIVTALYWAWTARIVFGETLALRRRPFVEAAVAVGVPSRTVIRRHVLPHLSSTILAVAALNGASVVVIGAGLSYLGAGIRPPTPEWGNMLAEGQDALSFAPHALLVPLACVVLTVLAFILIGEALARRGQPPRASWLDT